MSYVVGIDEVGRGAWAGPMVAAAVILDKPIIGLKDSKRLNKKQREDLSKKILDEALAIAIGWVSPEIIDEQGITKALKIAMLDALKQITIQYDKIIIDGNINYFKGLNLNNGVVIETVIKADDIYPEVSAASIVAKVARDKYMSEIALEYPEYGFDKNVGYGTAHHIDSIAKFGVLKIHRLSYKPVKLAISK